MRLLCKLTESDFEFPDILGSHHVSSHRLVVIPSFTCFFSCLRCSQIKDKIAFHVPIDMWMDNMVRSTSQCWDIWRICSRTMRFQLLTSNTHVQMLYTHTHTNTSTHTHTHSKHTCTYTHTHMQHTWIHTTPHTPHTHTHTYTPCCTGIDPCVVDGSQTAAPICIRWKVHQ